MVIGSGLSIGQKVYINRIFTDSFYGEWTNVVIPLPTNMDNSNVVVAEICDFYFRYRDNSVDLTFRVPGDPILKKLWLKDFSKISTYCKIVVPPPEEKPQEYQFKFF